MKNQHHLNKPQPRPTKGAEKPEASPKNEGGRNPRALVFHTALWPFWLLPPPGLSGFGLVPLTAPWLYLLCVGVCFCPLVVGCSGIAFLWAPFFLLFLLSFCCSQFFKLLAFLFQSNPRGPSGPLQSTAMGQSLHNALLCVPLDYMGEPYLPGNQKLCDRIVCANTIALQLSCTMPQYKRLASRHSMRAP